MSDQRRILGVLEVVVCLVLLSNFVFCRKHGSLSKGLGKHEIPGPYFIILGTQRGGTTALREYLKAHPNLWPASDYSKKEGEFRVRELSFFGTNSRFNFGKDYYRKLFLEAREEAVKEGTKEPILLFEKSPKYLCHNAAALRLYAHRYSDTKFIVLLRNPVDRTFSATTRRLIADTQEELDRDNVTMDLKIQKEKVEDIIKSELREAKFRARRKKSKKVRDGCGLLDRGHYAEQLERYYKYFSKEQILILKSEDFFDDPKRIVLEVLKFLEVSVGDFPQDYEFERIHHKERLPMSNQIRNELSMYYEPHNKNLYELLGRDFGWGELEEENEEVVFEEL